MPFGKMFNFTSLIFWPSKMNPERMTTLLKIFCYFRMIANLNGMHILLTEDLGH